MWLIQNYYLFTDGQLIVLEDNIPLVKYIVDKLEESYIQNKNLKVLLFMFLFSLIKDPPERKTLDYINIFIACLERREKDGEYKLKKTNTIEYKTIQLDEWLKAFFSF